MRVLDTKSVVELLEMVKADHKEITQLMERGGMAELPPPVRKLLQTFAEAVTTFVNRRIEIAQEELGERK